MGEAKRRKGLTEMSQAVLKAEGQGPEVPARMAQAVRQVMSSLTYHSGADCLLYARLTAGLLRSLGIADARVVAGSAAWRVGDGDTDVIAHARELAGGQLWVPDGVGQAAPFHAWVEVPSLKLLADFTTWTLRDKARQLDAADGGRTSVDWCPDYLWIEDREGPGSWVRTPNHVRVAEHAGAFTYVRHADIEARALAGVNSEEELAPKIQAVIIAYRAIKNGHTLHLFGVGEDGDVQEGPQERPLRMVG